MNLSPHPSWAGAGLAKEVQSLGCHGASLNWARASSSSSKFIPSLRGDFRVGHRRALVRAKAACLALCGRPWLLRGFRDTGVGWALLEHERQPRIWGVCLFALGFSGPQETREG